MINKLFTFTECDEVDQLVTVYENIELISSIGKHSPGTKFGWARIDYMDGRLVLGRVESHVVEWTYLLSLQIGPLISKESQQ